MLGRPPRFGFACSFFFSFSFQAASSWKFPYLLFLITMYFLMLDKIVFSVSAKPFT